MAGVEGQFTTRAVRTCGYVQNACSDGADEMNVVTDKDERPVILLERADQRVDRADIEMGRRLVHQEQVRGIEKQPDQRQSRFFAAAQNGHGLENIVTAKQKRAENSA